MTKVNPTKTSKQATLTRTQKIDGFSKDVAALEKLYENAALRAERLYMSISSAIADDNAELLNLQFRISNATRG